MKTDNYSDRVDVTTTISLYEYGIIRNPKTDKVIYCMNPEGEEHTKDNPPKIQTTFISLEEVKEALQDIGQGYFDFIGSDREAELSNLDNNHLSHHIHSINMYNGLFIEHLYYC